MLSRVLVLLLMAGVAAAADPGALPPTARDALEPAIAAAIDHFNADEDRQRQTPQTEMVGPPDEPSMVRATYRHAQPSHQVMGIEPGAAPVVTVRVRAVEFEKRATNVNSTDVRAEFDKARWQQTPRGYVLDFRLRWTGSAWEQVGDPTVYPTLGVVGRASAMRLLDSGSQR